MFLYLFFISIVFVGFVGYISRVDIAKELGASSKKLDLVIFRLSEESNILDKLKINTDDINKLRKENIELTHSLVDLKNKLDRENLEFNLIVSKLVRTTHEHRELFEAEFFVKFTSSISEIMSDKGLVFDTMRSISKEWSNFRFVAGAVPERLIEVRAIFDGIVTELHEKAKSVTGVANERRKFAALKDEKITEINAVEESLSAKTERLKEIKADVTHDERARLRAFDRPLWGLPYKVIVVPTIILTLVVTIAAGGLGSVVSFTRKFLFSSESAGASRLFANVGEGVAAAIAIFLFAGAGMLMFTEGSSATRGQIQLSPYLVAFIAFVSGFMAEQAFKRIQIAGENIFQSPPPAEPTAPKNAAPKKSAPKKKASPKAAGRQG